MQQLQQLDEQLEALLATDDDVDAGQLAQLLQHRNQLLQQLMAAPEHLDHNEWRAAVERTSGLLDRIRRHRERSAGQLKRLQHGQRSMQVYNTFR
ncbi:flagellar rod protein FlaI [Photobacterium atrarenae]|uniref:Flagellar rod protein FlaI n=1 Tax=Photobacterium atrarenae TaxID=865757 RepID=A0ABY5GCR9_9GAMM|nr:flagellar rod protein FlaI [Photobacterium atrarenae]UTV27034.1 flagellar rod protein FlaI [Photobacterium atrarenae]